MRLALFVRNLEDMDAAPIVASTDPALLEAVGKLIARHLSSGAAPALPSRRLRPLVREREETRPKET